jgi:Ca2+-binding RTX toxin-like protein
MGDFRKRWIALAALVAGLLCLPAGAAADQAAPPTCAEGPLRSGGTIVGTPCADRIVVPASVARVEAGPGNDTVIAAATSAVSECPLGCRLGVGSQTFEGGPGNDIVFGERGNDILRGNEGNDRLYGGIGDDVLEGGLGNDLLAGGFGADHLDGGPGSDFVRGDGTQDEIADSGPATDIDTLSYATAVTPGFGNEPAFPGMPAYPKFSSDHANFPAAGAERGVYLNLALSSEESGNNGGAPNGGGVDEVAGPDFERVVGSPFSDYIVGAAATQEILGGGGADVLISATVGTKLSGGADGDDCVGGVPDSSCESTAAKGAVASRDKSKVSLGAMAPGQGEYAELYLIGSESGDQVTVTTSGSAPSETVTFQLSGAEFDASAGAESGCEVESGSEAVCKLTTPLDSVLLAGLESDDRLEASGLPATTSLMVLGGDNADELIAGDQSDDTLVDGSGDDVLRGLGGDDALLNNLGSDELFGEDGNDLFLSTAICEGDRIDGAAGRDNASWAKFREGIDARLDQDRAGRPGPGGAPDCSGGVLDTLSEIEDLEGSSSADTFYGDGGENQLLGHLGADSYFAEAGTDTILANAGDDDAVIDCGEGIDTALIDRHPQYNDPLPSGCETVREADPNNYRAAELPPKEVPKPTPPVADTKPPRTKILKRPAKSLSTAAHHLKVVFRFSSSERGSRFRCKLDAKPYRPCSSPRAFMVRPGRHAVRIFAIDAAGNRDPSPALIRFRVRRR